ncbi:hypothetical protein UJ101_01394 [Flavobacteriaceae bacterium UJ101]|nr:hypothetical protein UJ101_01394 [Flavobacteriaceae bacterium UJ101]
MINKKLYKINLIWANVFSIIILLPILVLYGIPYYFIWGNRFKTPSNIDNSLLESILVNSLLIIPIIITGVIIHELVHGITWSLFAKKGFKSIKFGILWKMITPYCHCTEPLKAKHYRLGAIMPFIVLGIIPYIGSLLSGNLGLFLFSILFTIAASGDFLMLYMLRIAKPNQYVQDHPSEAGFYVFEE